MFLLFHPGLRCSIVCSSVVHNAWMRGTSVFPCTFQSLLVKGIMSMSIMYEHYIKSMSIMYPYLWVPYAPTRRRSCRVSWSIPIYGYMTPPRAADPAV